MMYLFRESCYALPRNGKRVSQMMTKSRAKHENPIQNACEIQVGLNILEAIIMRYSFRESCYALQRDGKRVSKMKTKSRAKV